LDLVRDDGEQAGQPVLAPVSGKIVWVDAEHGMLSISLGGNHYITVAHMDFAQSFKSGDKVKQGQVLGTVAQNGQNGNNGLAHIHITLYDADSPSADWTKRKAVPFSNDFAIDGYSFSPDGSWNQFTGTKGIASTNVPTVSYPTAKALKLSSVKANPKTFNPGNGEITTISYKITGGTSPYSIAFQVPGVRTINSTQQSEGAGSLAWDGKDDGGNIVPEGKYSFVLSVTGSGETSCKTKKGSVRVKLWGASSGSNQRTVSMSAFDDVAWNYEVSRFLAGTRLTISKNNFMLGETVEVEISPMANGKKATAGLRQYLDIDAYSPSTGYYEDLLARLEAVTDSEGKARFKFSLLEYARNAPPGTVIAISCLGYPSSNTPSMWWYGTAYATIR
jgi:hypothetical protein